MQGNDFTNIAHSDQIGLTIPCGDHIHSLNAFLAWLKSMLHTFVTSHGNALSTLKLTFAGDRSFQWTRRNDLTYFACQKALGIPYAIRGQMSELSL